MKIFDFSKHSTKQERDKMIGDIYALALEAEKSYREIKIDDGTDKKTPKQHRGYWRLIGVILPFLSKTYPEINSKDDASDFIKMQCNYFKVIKTKHKEIVLPRSLKEASKKDLMEFIEKIYFVCEFYGLKDYELTKQETED